MLSDRCTVHFPDSSYPSIVLENPQSQQLTVENSPVLFGCRTGICGTCLVLVKGNVSPPQPDEQEVLQILAPDTPDARLACQIQLMGDVEIRKMKAEE